MNKKILKFHIDISENQTVVMPEGSEIMCAKLQRGKMCLWAICPETKKQQPRNIEIFGTNHPLPPGNRTFIDTVIYNDGAFVWHVFEKA